MMNGHILPLLFLLLLPSSDHPPAWWSVQTSGTDSNLRGVSVVCDEGSRGKQHYFIWACGSNGVVLQSENDGRTWKHLNTPGGDLDFRDIEAFDADVAYLMSSGDRDKSRIYKTIDGGKSWKLQYSDKRAGFFLDSLACDSNTHCGALSDPVDGKFLVLSTDDGDHWKELPREKMPPALPQEGAFAASGTSIALCDNEVMYFGTGGPLARVFRSVDQGRSWTFSETPLASGTASAGIFSIACNGSDNVVVVGGDYKKPNDSARVAAFSQDGGQHWELAATQPGGYRSAIASFGNGDFAAVGPNGTDISHDKGAHWQHTDGLNLNALAFDGSNGWGVGEKGTVARFTTHFGYEIRNEPPQKLPEWIHSLANESSQSKDPFP